MDRRHSLVPGFHTVCDMERCAIPNIIATRTAITASAWITFTTDHVIMMAMMTMIMDAPQS